MKWLKRLKKRRAIVFFFVVIVLFVFLFRSKDYQKEYNVSGVTVLESYSKKDHLYTFLFRVNEKEFFVTFESQYKHSKRFVNQVSVNEKGNTICILPEGKLSFYPLCMDHGETVSFHLIRDNELIPENWHKELESEERIFGNVKIYHLNHHKYFLWNYKGFYVIDEKGEKEISLFQQDVYNVPLLYSVEPYLLLADYESPYVFHKFYVINSKNNKVQELNLDTEMSFDSYFLGVDKKKAYFVDKKNKLEYEIYPKRLLINKVTNQNQGKILVNGDWESISMVRLANEEKKFTFASPITYVIEEGTLYQAIHGQKTKLSNKEVKDIVSSDSSTVYYLVEDQLYYYNASDGEVLVLSNFEWNFNYKNMIFVF